ncbi:S41 family peptidase [Qipengyuania flava]|uniref:S41 family peptidase n=1 Tax=Qipengyuania flava TaxID=192812 RepID=UPI001C634082|nr:S41 family peptidase [Qipengyuania flava]QYJ08098.1 MarR family transcriptional regulator [Qipengyuania flava]
MNSPVQAGIGTKLRLLLTRMDGDLAALYAQQDTDFRPRFFPVFQLLLREEEALVSDIARALQVSQPAATQTLGEMKRLGFVSFEKGRDARERLVRLTPHAHETAEKLAPLWEAVSASAGELDGELSQPLGKSLDEANAALARESFADRISRHLAKAGRAVKAISAACLTGLALMAANPLEARAIDARDRAQVVENAAALLTDRYVDAAEGARLAQRMREEAGRWSAVDDAEAFARAVTEWLRAKSGDGHLGLSYSEEPIPVGTGEAEFSAAEMEKWYGAHINHGIAKIERLEGNIMLLDLRVFPPPAMAGDVIAAAMTLVAQGDALIIDLRRNGGGAETANLITGYLLDEGELPLTGTYNRPRDEHRASVSPAWVPGRRFGGTKPLYILTSKRTFSAAEALAYNLQALERAILVGEVTGGGAHPFEYRRVHPHFALDLPEGRSINPITGGNWQGTGVQPDVMVPAEDALETALSLARKAITAEEED